MEDLHVDMELCTGCRACELACASEHTMGDVPETAVLAVDPSAIECVQRGIRLQTSVAYARFERCLHCTDAPCVAACPNGAMGFDDVLGVVYVDGDRCQACFMCAMVCPFGAISRHPDTGLALKCDGCRERAIDGRLPACVEACEAKALQVGGGEDAARRRQRDTARDIAEAMGLPRLRGERSR